MEAFAKARFAAIADIHGNRWALEAVLEDIERRQVHHVVNLGDLLFGPLDVEGTAALLRRLDLPSVSGNQDREMTGPEFGETGAWLATLPFQRECPGMLLFHGTPLADDVYLLETVHATGVTLASPREIAERANLKISGRLSRPSAVPFWNYAEAFR